MDTARWQRIKELFQAAVERKGEERPAFLEEACGNDPALRAQIEDLLRKDTESPDFMETPPVSALSIEEPDENLVGSRLGQYLLKGIISSGGMGTVYQALQENPKRLVAVKVMKLGMPSRSALRRFEYESEILARLRHPGIAQIFEAGTHREGKGKERGGLPYIVMEYIPDAKPITEYARDKKLDMRNRLQLFLQACEAVHHGHEKGIIHRDLKPGNILVDGNGQVKIIDFGVARATDAEQVFTTLQTRAGQLIGTVQYMSPEQCDAEPGDVDIRSDVYALGVVLYELLCGELPYDVNKMTLYEAIRLIREKEPKRPRSINRFLHGDVETIVLKSLEKERERRYGTVASLAEDIGRFLCGDVILAKPVGPATRILKRVKRNPVVSTAVGAAALILVSFLLYIVLWSYPQIRAERDKVTQEARKAESINKFYEEMLESPDPEIDGREVRMVDVLDKAVKRIDDAFSGQAEIEASVRQTLGATYASLGQLSTAESLLRKALEIRSTLLGEEDPKTLLTMNSLAIATGDLGNVAEAEALLRKALAINLRVQGEEHSDTLRTMNNLACVLQDEGKWDDAESLFRRVLKGSRRTLGEEHRNTLATANNLVGLLRSAGKLSEAETLSREVLEMHLRSLGEKHPNTAIAIEHLAALLQEQGKLSEAQVLLRKVLEISLPQMGEEHPVILAAMQNLSLTLYHQGKLAEAEALIRRVVDIRRPLLGEENSDTLLSMNNLAGILLKKGELREAESIFRKVLETQCRVLGENHCDTLTSMNNLANVLDQRGALSEAEALLRNTVEKSKSVLGDGHRETILAKKNLAGVLKDLGKYSEGEAIYRDVVAASQRYLGRTHPATLEAMNELSVVLQFQNLFAEAEPISKQVVELAQTVLPPHHKDAARYQIMYGNCLLELERFDEAETILLKGYAGREAAFGMAHPDTKNAKSLLVTLYEKWGKPEKVAEWRAKGPQSP